MFDSATAQLLRSAPPVPGLDPQNIPALLTMHYANLVSARLSGTGDAASDGESGWTLERIGHLRIGHIARDRGFCTQGSRIRSWNSPADPRTPTSGRTDGPEVVSNVDRDRIDPTIAAALLFLAAEQYADAQRSGLANPSPSSWPKLRGDHSVENVADLARGHLNRIYERASRWRARRQRPAWKSRRSQRCSRPSSSASRCLPLASWAYQRRNPPLDVSKRRALPSSACCSYRPSWTINSAMCRWQHR